MAKKRTSTSKTQANQENIAEKLIKAYLDYVLEQGKRPNSVYHFAKMQEMEESAFYEHFNSLESLEKEIWGGFLVNTLAQIQDDETYQNYTVREKMLAFFYTFVEVLKQNRSYVIFCMKHTDPYQSHPFYLAELKKGFKVFAKDLINEGMETGEVKNRPIISDVYHRLLWAELRYIINFWAKDDSKGFEQTDAAVEKAVNTSLDLLGQTFVDSIFDFVKFTFQNK